MKDNQQADVLVALTHLGESSDFKLANNYPYFDLIIGGHSHTVTNQIVNNIPIFQAGSNLNNLGKIKLTLETLTDACCATDTASAKTPCSGLFFRLKFPVDH